MKKILLLVPLLFLSGCSSTVNTPTQNTGNIERISQLEQQLSGLFVQFSGLQQENVMLKESLSGQLVNLQILSQENESLKADVVKYKNALVQNMLNNKSSSGNTTANNIQTSVTNTSTVNTSQSTPTIIKNYGYIKDIYSAGGKNYIKIDYVEYVDCKTLNRCDASTPRIPVNNNPLIRTFEVTNNTSFEIYKINLELTTQEDIQLKRVNRSEFKIRVNVDGKNINPDYPARGIYYGDGRDTVVEIEHDSQKIYNVTAIWQS